MAFPGTSPKGNYGIPGGKIGLKLDGKILVETSCSDILQLGAPFPVFSIKKSIVALI